MHVVMFNSDYGKFDDSLTAEDGIVVLAVFFKVSLFTKLLAKLYFITR